MKCHRRGPTPKAQFIGTLSALLTMVELGFEAENALEQSLVDYEDGTADFAEYLHLALARKSEALPFWTFDRKAARTVGAKVLV